MRRRGWRLYATNQGAEQLSREQAVLAYRNEYQVEQSWGASVPTRQWAM
jgi:hypothetical protein